MFDICCIGHITRDKIITPQYEASLSGGTSFYFSYAIARLPRKVSYRLVTKLGRFDVEEVKRMRAERIDVVAFTCNNSVFFENRYEGDQNKRSQRVLVKCDPFKISEMNGVDAKVYHLGSLLNDDFSPQFVRELSTRGNISIDVQGFLRDVRGQDVVAVDWKEKLDILAHTHTLKLNEHEMEVITGLTDPRQVARQIASWGVKEVVITLGSNGSLIYADNTFYEIPAYPPRKLVDATGCGDTYSAGYLYCRAQGLGFAESGKFAAAMCTRKLEATGPYTPDKEWFGE